MVAAALAGEGSNATAQLLPSRRLGRGTAAEGSGGGVRRRPLRQSRFRAPATSPRLRRREELRSDLPDGAVDGGELNAELLGDGAVREGAIVAHLQLLL